MTQFKSWLPHISDLAVVIGIVILIIEVDQNTDMLRAQINQSRAETAMSEQQAFFNSDYMPHVLAKINNSELLTAVDTMRYERYFRSFNRNQDLIFLQYNEGFLADHTPRSIKSAVKAVIGSDEFGKYQWNKTKKSYSDAYIKFVDSALAEME